MRWRIVGVDAERIAGIIPSVTDYKPSAHYSIAFGAERSMMFRGY